MKVNWEGIYPAVTTKFTATGELDRVGFEKNIEAQLEAGVDAIVLGGTLGEASALTNDEKLTLTDWAVSLVNGRVPVILNIAEQTTSAAQKAASQAADHGASGLMMLPPMRYKADAHEVVTYYKAVANSSSLPIMIYNNPVDYGIEVTLDMFDQLLECETIQAVKESTRDVSNVTRMINRFGNRIKILSGVDTLALESIFMGADGWVAGLVCAFPRETVAIFRLAKAGRHQEALAIYRWFLPLLELDINSKLVQNIKLAESKVGLGSEHVRPPRLPLSGVERANVLAVIDSALASRPKLPAYKNLEAVV